MDAVSAEYNGRLVEWLNRLPGTAVPEVLGGGVVPRPHGVIHAGDLVDNGDKGPSKHPMAAREMQAFVADWGLNGGEGKLRWPVREVHGNHDSPRGDGPVIAVIKERNQRRAGLSGISKNGLHYSWDWAGVHFVALGLIVGEVPGVARQRRYGALGSLEFLREDLEVKVGGSGRSVVLVHHVDLHRYSEEVPEAVVLRNEWDYADVRGFHEAIKPYRVVATLCGHTHVRRIARWNGSRSTEAVDGIPFLNTDNAGHFGSETQAFLHVEINGAQMCVREFATKDGWETGGWTAQQWSFAV